MGRHRKYTEADLIKMALSSAEKLVERGGLAEFSARKVAADIGCPVSMLYTVFASLDDLILRVNGKTLDDMKTAMEKAANKCKTPEGCIKSLAHAYVGFSQNNTGRWTAVYDHTLPENTPLPEWYASKVESLFALVEEQLRPVPGLTQQKISKIAKTLWSGVHGICVLAITQKYEAANVASVVPLIDGLISNYLAGLMLGLKEVNQK